jgi:plasmid stability protein
MATLYVENVADELYEALRDRARADHRSIAAEVISLLEQNILTQKELRARRKVMQRLGRLDAGERSEKQFPSTEEMLRHDRVR